MNRTQLTRINSNVEVWKRDYSTAQVKEIARKCALVKANLDNTKLNVYENILQEVCEKFNGAEVYIRERIKELCSEGKLSVEEVMYLLMNDFNSFQSWN